MHDDIISGYISGGTAKVYINENINNHPCTGKKKGSQILLLKTVKKSTFFKTKCGDSYTE